MNSPVIINLLIILVACLSGISSDIYAPSLLVISDSFSASIDTAQVSMAVFMVGSAFAQLFYGPLSEGFGRKKILLIGLFIMLSGTCLCFLAPSMWVLICGRFLQGMGAGAGTSLWRAIFRDSFDDQQSAKYIPFITMTVTFVIPAAPIFGAFLEQTLGWRYIFFFLAIYAVLCILYISFFFKESNVDFSRAKLKRHYIAQSYKTLASSPIFLGYSACIFLCYGAFFAWLITGPIIVIKNFGYSQFDFGMITFFGGGCAMALSGYVNSHLAKKFGFDYMLRVGWRIMIGAGVLLYINSLLWPTNLVGVIIPIVCFYFGVTFVWPATFTGAFKPFKHIAGYAGSFYSFLQVGGAGFLGVLIAYLPDNNPKPLAFVFVTAPSLAFIIYKKVIAPAQRQLEIE